MLAFNQPNDRSHRNWTLDRRRIVDSSNGRRRLALLSSAILKSDGASTFANARFVGYTTLAVIGWTRLIYVLYKKRRNAWQSLAYSPLGAVVSPPSEYYTNETHLLNKKHLKNVGPIRYCEPLYAACFTLPFTKCRYCRTPPAHRCPQQHR